MIQPGQEVAVYADQSQFEPGHSVDKCGFYAVWQDHFCGQPGAALASNTGQLIQSNADITYTSYDGADTASNNNGMSLEQLYQLIIQAGNHFQALWPGQAAINSMDALHSIIRYWLALGYPVIISVDEASVYDQELDACPYNWNPTPGQYSHIITVSGMQSNNVDYLVRDTASVDSSGAIRPGPRKIEMTPLKIQSATVFVPPWLPRPYSATQQLPPPPPPPAQLVKADVAQLQKIVSQLVTDAASL